MVLKGDGRVAPRGGAGRRERGRGSVIEFSGVRFGYGERRVIEDATLALEPGTLHFLTGRSGAGKTTLLRLAHLSLAPQAGTVTLFGRDGAGLGRAERARLRRRLGLVTQECDLLDHLSVEENVALPLKIAGEDPRARAGDVRALLDWAGLGDRLGARPPELSSGERRRAAVARAVMAGPDAILADEPTGDVDPEGAERILDLFLQLHATGRAVLVATHDLGLIRRAQGRSKARTLRLEGGRTIRAGAPL